MRVNHWQVSPIQPTWWNLRRDLRSRIGSRQRPLRVPKYFNQSTKELCRVRFGTLNFGALAALRAIDSPTIANAIEEFDARDRRAGYMDSSIRCLYPELGEIVGYAYTITFKNREPHDPTHAPAVGQGSGTRR